MKIAIINDLLGSGSNGTFLVTYNLLEHLKRQGHEVCVICPDQSKLGDPDYRIMPVRHFGAAIDKYVEKVGVSISKCSRKEMEEALRGAEYIHCITPFELAVVAADIARENNIPISAGFHIMAENITAYLGVDGVEGLNTHIYKHLYRTLYGKVDGIHYPTSFIKNHFERRIGEETPAYVISNGAAEIFKKRDCVRDSKLQGKIVITSTGRYSREKAQEVLIEAIAQSKHEREIQLVLAGHGARDEKYKRLAASLTNPPILKVFSHEQMAELLNCTDIYVHPAYIELEGIACLEAMKCGVPTIVSDSPLSATYDFAVDPACIFEAGESKELAERIDALIDDPVKREYIAQKTLESNVQYVGECMCQMDDMIADVIKRKATNACA